jgi:hypothetical protein
MVKKKPPVLRGRPTVYSKCHAEMAYKLCLLGATNEQLASFFNVCPSTIDNWIVNHPDFLGAIKRGKIEADANVAEALYHRALGYSHPDVHISNYQGDITITPLKKHYPPDTAAAFIWLKNRSNWKDKSEIDVKDERLTDQEIEDVRRYIRRKIVKSQTVQ